jgi:hypothetical protein
VRWRTTGFFDYHPYFGASVVDAALYTWVVGGTYNGSQPLNVYWANEDGPHYFTLPRWHAGSAPPTAGYTLSTLPYVSSAISTGAAWHNGTWLPTLYNNWTRTGSAGGVLLFKGNEGTSADTYKKFGVAVLLVIQQPDGSLVELHRWTEQLNVFTRTPRLAQVGWGSLINDLELAA